MWGYSRQSTLSMGVINHSSMLFPPPPFFFFQISSFNWDHNDNFAQFSGCHALLPEGYGSIFAHLAEGMDIHLDTIVRRVELVPGVGGVKVTDSRGNTFNGDKVCDECGRCMCGRYI